MTRPRPTYVFAFNRGAGSSLGPTFSGVPGITPDALVTLTVGPYGSSATGTITDLTTGASQSIPSSSIKIQGPVVRVYLNTSQLPSRGWPLQKYRFAFWTQTQPGNDITSVASFAPNGSMIPIGVLKGVAADAVRQCRPEQDGPITGQSDGLHPNAECVPASFPAGLCETRTGAPGGRSRRGGGIARLGGGGCLVVAMHQIAAGARPWISAASEA